MKNEVNKFKRESKLAAKAVDNWKQLIVNGKCKIFIIPRKA